MDYLLSTFHDFISFFPFWVQIDNNIPNRVIQVDICIQFV
ncbi:hypothetical protein B4102_0107 [Heyndrickxia sporothermodurans]|uniref:Uncharacterized protein n=1 Tax=Heyndrickxia sporothermodurans TaxID=46224 RepID=A0A150LFC8_9BACI|nr:hypothetical protein B4102_0107 [Heyndrickxia sporothermodurans]